MSYDLHVIAARQPSADVLGEFAAAAGLTVDGTYRTRGSALVLDEQGTAVELDGPNRLEAADLPDAANGAVGRSGWLVELSKKGEASWPSELAVALARAGDGVVYDPQLDAVVWPPGWLPKDPVSQATPIETVAVSWYTRRPTDPRAFARRFVDLLAAHCPEALPVRYGDHEPLQRRFDGPVAADDFAEFAAPMAARSLTSIFWTARSPCFGGSISSTAERREPGPGPTAITRSTLTFDARAFARDPAFADRTVAVLEAVAASLGGFYAAAWVERGHEVRRGRLWGTGATETGPLPRADVWVGLPAAPTWLAWFGPPYAELLRAVVGEGLVQERGDSILVRAGQAPMNADELADVFPPLPAWLVARRRDQPGVWLPRVRYSLVGGPPSGVAEMIPPLELPTDAT